MVIDQVREHYKTLWGQPSRSALFTLQRCRVEIYKWNEDSNPEEVCLYASIGASLHPLVAADPDHRIEVFTGMLPEQDAIAKPLSMLAMEPGLHRTNLVRGHTVIYPEPLWGGTKMSGFLVLGPVPELIPHLEVSNGTHVEFLQVVPIFPSELRFKKLHGVDALIERWEDADVPFWDPGRAPEPR
jgi:hypothetical protein